MPSPNDSARQREQRSRIVGILQSVRDPNLIPVALRRTDRDRSAVDNGEATRSMRNLDCPDEAAEVDRHE